MILLSTIWLESASPVSENAFEVLLDVPVIFMFRMTLFLLVSLNASPLWLFITKPSRITWEAPESVKFAVPPLKTTGVVSLGASVTVLVGGRYGGGRRSFVPLVDSSSVDHGRMVATAEDGSDGEFWFLEMLNAMCRTCVATNTSSTDARGGRVPVCAPVPQ